MKRLPIASVLVVTALVTIPTLFAQDSTNKVRREERLAPTNITVSGTLSMQIGMMVDKPTTNALGEHGRMFVASSTNKTSGASTNGQPVTIYTLTTSSSNKVLINPAIAKESPVKLSDFLDQPITLVGKGMERELSKGKITLTITKITSITKNTPAQSGTAP